MSEVLLAVLTRCEESQFKLDRDEQSREMERQTPFGNIIWAFIFSYVWSQLYGMIISYIPANLSRVL